MEFLPGIGVLVLPDGLCIRLRMRRMRASLSKRAATDRHSFQPADRLLEGGAAAVGLLVGGHRLPRNKLKSRHTPIPAQISTDRWRAAAAMVPAASRPSAREKDGWCCTRSGSLPRAAAAPWHTSAGSGPARRGARQEPSMPIRLSHTATSGIDEFLRPRIRDTRFSGCVG